MLSSEGFQYLFVSLQPKYKKALEKTSHDFQLSLVAFQRAQQASAERQRTVVETVKHAVEDESQCAPTTQPLPHT